MSEGLRKKKILVVDDSEMNRSILADMLGDDYEILEATNGVEAIAAIKGISPEQVIRQTYENAIRFFGMKEE